MLTIPNWSKYQSYRDRRPPWIRFHKTMIDNYEFQMMSAESRALLPMLWLLACENPDPTSGVIDQEVEVIAFRLRSDEKIIRKSIVELEKCGFIDCAGIVTDSYKDSTKPVTTETETEAEAETEAEGNKPKRKRFVKPSLKDVFNYMIEKGLHQLSEAEKFIDYYESNGWKVGGKGAMKNWQAAVRNWVKRVEQGYGQGRGNSKQDTRTLSERVSDTKTGWEQR